MEVRCTEVDVFVEVCGELKIVGLGSHCHLCVVESLLAHMDLQKGKAVLEMRQLEL